MSFTLPTISALGTSWWIEVFEEMSETRRAVILHDCAAFLQTFENYYSRFKPDSYISRLNSTRKIVTPPTELIELLTFGSEQYTRTAGVFNIMIGSTLVETGYDAAYTFTPTAEQTPITTPDIALTITPDEITLNHGLVDIGGFGKGFVIDLLARRLEQEHALQYFLINGGGDMFATSDNGQPISIYLEHPTIADSYLSTTTLLNQGFAASSPHKRTWRHAGTTFTHIIDTTAGLNKTARPDATFIKAASACTADIFATVALLVPLATMNVFAEQEQLGVASFYLADGTFTHNQAFI